ncbi:zincin [Tilletiaria anomala UBC 951]|uniref:Zincin n=1 Tax=Tilletiaria anomala (strain ATCC 24038 / CBS 436.72 / UBC 951) TaxID=1037660 RepID=A0A066V597_TILAU|nr:zincin [Tilletiaria anomala UBC 951]KDN36661.1 zincin [Tilletiaria anomala UBC 951]
MTTSRMFHELSHGFNETIAPLAEPERLRPLEKALLLLALVLFLLTSVFVGLFAGAQHKLAHSAPPWSSPWPSPTPSPPNKPGHSEPPVDNHPPETCFTRDCVLTASDILRGIDESFDPCDDFYSFAVNGWLSSHPIPADAGLFGAGQYVAATNAKVVQKLLEAAPSKPRSKDFDERSLTKLKGFYNSCMDPQSQDKYGNEPLLEILEEISFLFSKRDTRKVKKHAFFASLTDQLENPNEADLVLQGEKAYRDPLPPNIPPGRSPRPHLPSDKPGPLPPAPGGANSRQARFTRTLAWVHSRGLPALFQWTIDGDYGKDPQLGTPALFAGGLGLPDTEYYEDKDELEFYGNVIEQALFALRAEMKQTILTQGEGMGEGKIGKKELPSKEAIRHLTNQVVKFEQSLANITPSSTDADPSSSYNPTNLTILSYSMRSIEWPSYFSALAVRPPRVVILNDPSFVTRLDSLISRTQDEVLEAYLLWTAIRSLGLNLGPGASLRKPADRLDRRAKGVDPDAEEDRLTTCLASLNQALGFMTGRFFVQEAFSAEAKAKAESIVVGIVEAFKSRLPELDWLDEKTRSYAREKADAVRVKVGYPDRYPNTTNASAIFNFYADLNVHEDDYFGNRRQWSYTDRVLNPARWDMYTSEVNAYYNPGGNEIVFPAGLLQPPYFSMSWPDFMQYGAFGTTAGHELSHAFDPAGRLYDKDGYLRDWWSKDTTAEFNKRKECLLAQYGNYTISDGKGGQLHLNAKLSIGEDVADGGGIEQSFRAWWHSLQSGGDAAAARNALLPGVKYTREQLFFIAYGLAWARNIRTEEGIRRLRTDEHSPTKYRVIGPVSNSRSFAAAFGCKAGVDRMARSDSERCEIW